MGGWVCECLDGWMGRWRDGLDTATGIYTDGGRRYIFILRSRCHGTGNEGPASDGFSISVSSNTLLRPKFYKGERW